MYFFKSKQIEPIGYTTAEIRGMTEAGNKFIENVFREGKDIELNKFRVRSMKGMIGIFVVVAYRKARRELCIKYNISLVKLTFFLKERFFYTKLIFTSISSTSSTNSSMLRLFFPFSDMSCLLGSS